jgi:hypothetical protein
LVLIITGRLDVKYVFVIPVLIAKPRRMLVLRINPDSAFLFDGGRSASAAKDHPLRFAL